MDCQRIWLSLSCLLGMICGGLDANAISRTDTKSTTQTVSCMELPTTSCGIVSKSRTTKCSEFWYTKVNVNDQKSCAEAFQHDPNFSEYITCSRMYRNMGKFNDLNYTIQFGNELISNGACKATTAYPSCDQAASVPAGSFCRCRAGAPFAAVGCDPNESNSDCFSMSLAPNCDL